MQRGLHQSFGLAIKGRGSLIQNQDGRVLEQCPRNCQPLALASGKSHAACSDHSIVPCRQRQNEIVRQCGTGRGLDFFLWNLGLAVSDVVANRIVEQNRLLCDDANLRPQRGEGYFAEVLTINEQTSRRDIEEAGNQMDERAFAGTAQANDSKKLTGLNFQISIVQQMLN